MPPVSPSSGDGPFITHIIRHIAFAPHRFESFAGPRRQYACMLNAMFLCLAGIANDVRKEKAVRDRAVYSMESMTWRDIFVAGLAGDFGEFASGVHLAGDGRTKHHCGPSPAIAPITIIIMISIVVSTVVFVR